MKKLFVLTAILGLTAATFAAVPSAPSGAFVPGLVTIPATNAISAPVGFFPAALVYGAPFKPANATMFSWLPNAEPDLGGYNVYFGDLLNTNVFAKLPVPKAVNSVVLLGLNTNVVYGIYVTATNTASQESPSSVLVVLKPGTP